MKVVVCGAGQVGFNIARYLSAEQADVTVIDQSPGLIQKTQDSLDVRGVLGHASQPHVLEEANIADADMLVAVTASDEVNMVACQIAHSLFSVPTKIARVRARSYLDPAWSDLYNRDNLPIDHIISPEIEVARAIGRRLSVPGAFDVIPLAQNKVRVVGVHCGDDCPVINTPLRQLAALFPDLNIVVIGVIRDERSMIPTPEEQMLAGDEVYFVSETSHVSRALAAFGQEEREARRIIILGGGNIGLNLAEDIESWTNPLVAKIIEFDKTRAQHAARTLSRTTVINGDGLDLDILGEASVKSAEVVVAVTNDDKVNMIASLLAKRQGARRAVTLVNEGGFVPLIRSLGVDAVVSPREITVSSILQHVRRGRILSVHSIGEGLGEIIEAEALETSEIVGAPLREVDFPPSTMVAAVVRANGTVVIPTGDTVVLAKDRIVIFAAAEQVKAVERMLRVRPEFF